MAKLNPNAQKWVDALRSGKYQQCKEQLRNQDGHCCMGVLCEVAIANGVEIFVRVEPSGTTTYNNNATVPPRAAMEWVGLQRSNGSYGGGCLTNDNDNGVDFSKIADQIEKKAEILGVSA